MATYGLGIRDPLFFEYPRRQRSDSIRRMHRHGALQNNRSVIILVVHVMHGAAALGAPGLQHGLVNLLAEHSLASELWQ